MGLGKDRRVRPRCRETVARTRRPRSIRRTRRVIGGHIPIALRPRDRVDLVRRVAHPDRIRATICREHAEDDGLTERRRTLDDRPIVAPGDVRRRRLDGDVPPPAVGCRRNPESPRTRRPIGPSWTRSTASRAVPGSQYSNVTVTHDFVMITASVRRFYTLPTPARLPGERDVTTTDGWAVAIGANRGQGPPIFALPSVGATIESRQATAEASERRAGSTSRPPGGNKFLCYDTE